MNIPKREKEIEVKSREARIKTVVGIQQAIKVMAEKSASPSYNPQREIGLVIGLVQNLFRIYQFKSPDVVRLSDRQKTLLENALKEGLKKGEKTTFQYLDATFGTIAKELHVNIPNDGISL
jgi:hypothetical protein